MKTKKKTLNGKSKETDKLYKCIRSAEIVIMPRIKNLVSFPDDIRFLSYAKNRATTNKIKKI